MPPAFSISSAAVWIVPGSFGLRRLGLGGDRDIGAVARGAQRDREPDAARGAGDEQRLALERHALLLPLAGQERFERLPSPPAICRRSLNNRVFLDRCERNLARASPRISAREIATAPGGSAAISRAAFIASASTSCGCDHRVDEAGSLACVGIERTAHDQKLERAALAHERAGASRLDAGFRYQPEAGERRRKRRIACRRPHESQ